MTESEVIKNLEKLIHLWENDENMSSDTMKIEIDQELICCINKAIEEIWEVQQYRATGLTPDQIRRIDTEYRRKCEEVKELEKRSSRNQGGQQCRKGEDR